MVAGAKHSSFFCNKGYSTFLMDKGVRYYGWDEDNDLYTHTSALRFGHYNQQVSIDFLLNCSIDKALKKELEQFLERIKELGYSARITISMTEDNTDS